MVELFSKIAKAISPNGLGYFLGAFIEAEYCRQDKSLLVNLLLQIPQMQHLKVAIVGGWLY
ncbi:MAG: hypothetical protein EOO46_14630 [Flavobacterium sp.]|nr:MAG: hypothetical protein EOO46_14630 [Flavobacterium sp.]